MEFKDKLRIARKSKGLTQEELAAQSGLATITIRQYESGKRNPKFENIKRISAALQTDFTEFLNFVTPVEYYEEDIDSYIDTFLDIFNNEFRNAIIAKNEEAAFDAINKLIPYFQVLDDYQKREPEKNHDLKYGLDIVRPYIDFHDTDCEKNLLFYFALLNKDGQQVAVDRVKELTEIERYREIIKPAHDET